jgi:tetratricopeptide (TPR) repeat protein
MRPFIIVFFTICSQLFSSCTVTADQNNAQLDKLFMRLKETSKSDVATKLEDKIWQAWLHSGRKDIDALMAKGTFLMNHHQLDDALEQFNQVVDKDPGYAEGWNKRATAYYLLGDLAQSMKDIKKTLNLEPRHFGALSGMGLIFSQLGDREAALQAYREVLRINPNAFDAKQQIKVLQSKILEDSI